MHHTHEPTICNDLCAVEILYQFRIYGGSEFPRQMAFMRCRNKGLCMNVSYYIFIFLFFFVIMETALELIKSLY